MQTYFTREDIFNIFRSIVINYPDNDCCSKLDTFAEVCGPDDFNSSNLNRTYNDFLAGKFYSKKWVANGSPKAAMKGSFGRLLVEQRELELPASCSLSEIKHQWYVTIQLLKGCPSCGKKGVTDSEMIQRTQDMALCVWNELMKYGLYEDINSEDKTDKDGNPIPIKHYFLTDDHAHVLTNCDNDMELVASGCGLILCDCLDTSSMTITPMKEVDGLMGVVLDFKTIGCYTKEVEMSYKCDNLTPTHIAHATCSIC